MIEVLFWSFMGLMLGFLICQLGRIWGDYITPVIRDWLYERKMDKARQEFMRDLYRELEKEKRANEQRRN